MLDQGEVKGVLVSVCHVFGFGKAGGERFHPPDFVEHFKKLKISAYCFGFIDLFHCRYLFTVLSWINLINLSFFVTKEFDNEFSNYECISNFSTEKCDRGKDNLS